jgi:hypothetical protein
MIMMKIALALLLVFSISTMAMADDALVMPAKVIRVYATGAFASADKEYDGSGASKDIPGMGGSTVKASYTNIGFAAEFGATDWITAAVQWAPGWNVASKLDITPALPMTLNANGFADIFAGAKFQIVGPKAPVQNETIRFAIAPGVKIPVGAIDWKTQATNLTNGKDATVYAIDKHILGVGARGYFDYVINEMFFLNLYSQFMYYPTAVKTIDDSLVGYMTVSSIQAGMPTYNPSLNYGYDLTLEFEPHFNYKIADGLTFSAGLPVTYSLAPALKVADDTLGAITKANGFALDASNILTIGPNVSIMTMKTALPLELKAGYTMPLMGENKMAMSSFVVQLKVYAKF